MKQLIHRDFRELPDAGEPDRRWPSRSSWALAFAAVVNSFVNDLVTPIIAAIFGKPSFREPAFTIHSSRFFYGSFITD